VEADAVPSSESSADGFELEFDGLLGLSPFSISHLSILKIDEKQK